MRTLCDVCESAAAILFCAADEAALCRACDDKVHMCNKLASRHIRVGLAEPSKVQCCDICETSAAFFYCEIDGSSLCLQCDMKVHVDRKRTHRRYLLLRQRIEFPGGRPGIADETGLQRDDNLGDVKRELMQLGKTTKDDVRMENKLIDLNARPPRMQEHAPNNQERMDAMVDNDHESEHVVPDGYFKQEP